MAELLTPLVPQSFTHYAEKLDRNYFFTALEVDDEGMLVFGKRKKNAKRKPKTKWR